MKILRVAGMHYVSAKTILYELQKNLNELPYEEQLRTIHSYYFHYGDSLTENLQRIGYECTEVVFDLELLQKKWAEESGCVYSKKNWQNDILIQQILTIKPEILFLQNLQTPSLSILKQRKHIFPFLKCLVIFRGYPETNRALLEYLSLADLLLVGSPILYKTCKDHGLRPHLFYHYFDDRLLNCIHPCSNQYPCTFLGTSGWGFDWVHQPRYFYLHELLKGGWIECWLEESSGDSHSWKKSVKKILEWIFGFLPDATLDRVYKNPVLFSSLNKLIFNTLAKRSSARNGYLLFPETPLSQLYPERCHNPLFGLEMYQVLSQSRITFNKHSFAASGTADNIRLFQATGVGSCLLTDSGTNLDELFEIDREVVTYSSLDECKEKIHFLSTHEATRASIAAKGQARTLKDHTAANRARQLDEALPK